MVLEVLVRQEQFQGGLTLSTTPRSSVDCCSSQRVKVDSERVLVSYSGYIYMNFLRMQSVFRPLFIICDSNRASPNAFGYVFNRVAEKRVLLDRIRL